MTPEQIFERIARDVAILKERGWTDPDSLSEWFRAVAENIASLEIASTDGSNAEHSA